MGYLLGFGIPIAYLVTGLFMSRALWRSRHKRGLNGTYDTVDSEMMAGLMVFLWPLFAPVYFPLVATKGDYTTGLHRFYNTNLPETNEEKELRRKQEAWDYRKRIRDLELECGLKPTEKNLGRRPEKRTSWY